MEGVVAQWRNPVVLKSEQAGGMGRSPVGPPGVLRLWPNRGVQSVLKKAKALYFCDPSAWC